VAFVASFSNLVSAKSPKIHLVTEHLPPYQIVAQDGKITGFSVDVIEQTMLRSHYPFTLKSYPWLRSYNLARQKANHCIFSIARLASREKLFKWVGPLSEVNNAVIWGLKNREIKIESLEEAKAYMIAVNRNDITHTGLVERGFVEGENLYVLNDVKSLVKLITTRTEIDLIVADDITIGFRTKMAGVAMAELERVYEITDLPLNFFFACSQDTDDKIVTALSTSMTSLYLDGTYQRIWDKWRDKLSSDHKP
jgi:polar amino acid transport system substrate-binding protein